MMVFWKARLVVLAMPKTGTQAYEAALSERADMVIRHPPGLKHMSLQRYRNKIRPLLRQAGAERMETLAVIRAPRDWLGSWFRYRQRPALKGHTNSTAGLSFAEFIEGFLAEEPPSWADVGRPYRFVSDGQGRVAVDHLFAYDHQDALQAFLAERLGHPVIPPRRNNSPDAGLDLPEALEARLARALAPDLALHAALMAGESVSGRDFTQG